MEHRPWDPYDRVVYHGKVVNRRTKAMIKVMEKRLGYPLDIWQGSYSKGVGVSAGTHDGGGVVDLSPVDAGRKMRVGAEVGFAVYHRRTWQGDWVEHLHFVAMGDKQLASLAALQVKSWRNGWDGLGAINPSTGQSNARDPDQWRPKRMDEYKHRRRG